MSETVFHNSLQGMLSYFSLQKDPFGRDIETSQLLHLPLINEKTRHEAGLLLPTNLLLWL